MAKRSPIVVILGHVDHGKTTLLDYIRKTNIAAKEVGGITQTIGAYEIIHKSKSDPNQPESRITFIDTPGHEAFSQMRAHGARVADLAILVVAADDGVMPQTKESIEILKKSETPFIVAINKIDRPNADINKVKQQLAEIGVFLEGYGGHISWQAISAKTGEGVSELLDLIVLAAELENLQYQPENQTRGFILKVQKDPRRGNVITAIVKDGLLKLNQFIATPSAQGKIKSLENFLGQKVKELIPSSPAVIFGFENLPEIGEEFIADFKEVKSSVVKEKIKTSSLEKTTPEDQEKILKLILRADEIGSLKALENLIEKLAQKYPIKIINSDIGDIHEEETKLAEATQAIIVGFKVKIDKAAKNFSRIYKITIITSEIIYDLEKNLEEYLKKLNPEITGILEVLALFGERKGKNQIIGGKVKKGTIKNKEKFEIKRKEEIIGWGRILNLQSQKKDVLEVKENQEAGLLVESEININIGDELIFKNQ